jgi:hypothetical protein
MIRADHSSAPLLTRRRLGPAPTTEAASREHPRAAPLRHANFLVRPRGATKHPSIPMVTSRENQDNAA